MQQNLGSKGENVTCYFEGLDPIIKCKMKPHTDNEPIQSLQNMHFPYLKISASLTCSYKLFKNNDSVLIKYTISKRRCSFLSFSWSNKSFL